MVYITSEDGKEKKFACIKCIKGHRSTKCNHANRELFEIKKKGRPVSQCDTCRQLRKTKQIHIKCMCHLNIKLKETLNSNPIRDEGFRHSDLSSNVNKLSTLPNNSCTQCDRPTLYCICSKRLIESTKRKDIGYASSSSSDGSLTPPVVYQLGYTDTPIHHSAGLNVNAPSRTASNSNSTISPTTYPNNNIRHLTIPIHDPSDDINSDTPIYKSHEENIISDKTAVLGEFTNTSSEDLMNQIYSGFIDNKDGKTSSCTSSPLLREADHQLVELSKND